MGNAVQNTDLKMLYHK